MYCHHNDQGPVQPKSSGSGGEMSQSVRRGGAAAVVGGAIFAIAPHAACVVGGLSFLGLGGLAIHSVCKDHAPSGHTITHGGNGPTRLPELPSSFQEFPKSRNEAAARILLQVEPQFQIILDEKIREAKGAPVAIVFLDANDRVTAVVCKNGSLCPCSEPQAYDLGSRADIALGERFAGQHQVLKALYQE